MKEIVERFCLSKWLSTQDAKAKLAMAGFRGPAAETTFLFFRLVTPIALVFVAAFYPSSRSTDFGLSLPILAAIVLGRRLSRREGPGTLISPTPSRSARRR